MGKLNKLNVIDSIPMHEGHSYALRLRDDLNGWIDDNAKGSKNSIINFLINVGINNVTGILERDSLYEEINAEEDEDEKD